MPTPNDAAMPFQKSFPSLYELPGVLRCHGSREHKTIGRVREVEGDRVVRAVIVKFGERLVPPSIGLGRRLDASCVPAVKCLVQQAPVEVVVPPSYSIPPLPLKNATNRLPWTKAP